MFADRPNIGILAAAGSRKTQEIIDTALAIDGRILLTTYTTENLNQIRRRIQQQCGIVPANVELRTWFSFLIAHGAKPFQASVLGRINIIRGLNFDGEPLRFTKKTDANSFYLDSRQDLYRKNLADFVVAANVASGEAVADRIGRIFDAVLIDELQDLAGWDLDFVDILLAADVNVLLVGDPRQHTYSTYPSNKNKRYRGMGIIEWLDDRREQCARLDRAVSYRCNQAICDYADRLYPTMPATESVGVPETDHDGVFLIDCANVRDYYNQYSPVVLRPRVTRDTQGLPAMNIGVAKGSTFDRVLLFPTRAMAKFATTGDLNDLTAPASLYVAVTRARHSVAIVTDT